MAGLNDRLNLYGRVRNAHMDHWYTVVVPSNVSCSRTIAFWHVWEQEIGKRHFFSALKILQVSVFFFFWCVFVLIEAVTFAAVFFCVCVFCLDRSSHIFCCFLLNPLYSRFFSNMLVRQWTSCEHNTEVWARQVRMILKTIINDHKFSIIRLSIKPALS